MSSARSPRIGLLLLVFLLLSLLFTVDVAGAVEENLRGLIESAGMNPWPFKKSPPAFELPSDRGGKIALDRDLKGKVLLLYMFAEW